jgi:hypothetical protein
VRAGEPVLRVETDEPVYLVGTVKYRGMLRIGSKLKVTSTLFEAAGAADTEVSGEVVAVRGHDSVSEQWDLLVVCSNRTAAGDPILPLNYNFARSPHHRPGPELPRHHDGDRWPGGLPGQHRARCGDAHAAVRAGVPGRDCTGTVVDRLGAVAAVVASCSNATRPFHG